MIDFVTLSSDQTQDRRKPCERAKHEEHLEMHQIASLTHWTPWPSQIILQKFIGKLEICFSPIHPDWTNTVSTILIEKEEMMSLHSLNHRKVTDL